MDSRKIKQIIYGTGYSVIFVGIVVGAYFLWLQPAPTCFDDKQNDGETGVDCGGPACIPCEMKNLSPLFASNIKYFPANDAKSVSTTTAATIIAAEITNPNQNYGATGFRYSINIYGKDSGQIKNITGSYYIYPGEIKHLIQNTDVNVQDIGEIKMTFSGENWQPKEQFPQPILQIRQVTTEESAAKNSGAIVNGFVKNNNPYDLREVIAIALLFNKDAQEISAAQTKLNNVSAFGEMPFTINFPKNISLIQESIPTPQVFTFTRDLTLGSKGEDILQLERFLKNQGYFSIEPDDYFGTATRDALIKYQKQVGISPAAGYFGGKTRADINALAAKAASAPAINPNQADPTKTKVYVEGFR